MKSQLRLVTAVAALACLLTCSFPIGAQDALDESLVVERALKQAAAAVSPSVVRIETVGGLDRVGGTLASTGPTTGIIVSADGEIITSSFNFASKPSSILVTLPDGRRFAAEKIASDQVKMLTLIKIEATNLIPAKPAPRDSFRVGQWAVALGRTYDTPIPSVSVGIVSALNRIWGKAIQTDAKVSPVNYGGPLVDIEGRVLGVLVPLSPEGNTEAAGVQWYDAGIGFAIPLADVYSVLDRLREGQDLRHGLLGISFKTKDIYGTAPLLDRVRYDSPAQKADLKPGDVISAINGEPVTRIAEVRHALGNSYEGDKVALTIKRGEESLEAEATLTGELKPYESAFLGILPQRPSAGQDPQKQGVGIRYVYPDSPAAKIGLQQGDQILKLGEIKIASASDLRDGISRIRPGQDAELTALSGGETKTFTVELAVIPAVIPENFIPDRPPVAEEEEAAGEKEEFGRITETLEGHERDLWAFIPEDYTAEHNYALMVWLHPAGDTMEAAMLKAWKPICRDRGIILLAPKAEKVSGWTANETGFVKAAVESFLAKYSIDRERVVLHGYAEGAGLAQLLIGEERELFSGISLASAPLQMNPPENRPEYRLQWHLICGEKDRFYKPVQRSEEVLGKLRFPVTLRSMPNVGHSYPAEDYLEELGRWIDSLDRI